METTELSNQIAVASSPVPRRMRLSLLWLMLIPLSLAGGVLNYSLQRYLSGFIYGVRLGNTALDGLPLVVARQKVEEVCQHLQRQPLTIHFTDANRRIIHSRVASMADLGISADAEATWKQVMRAHRRRNPLLALAARWVSPESAVISLNIVYTVHASRGEQFFEQVRRVVERPPRDARLLVEENGSRRILPEQTGLTIPPNPVEHVLQTLREMESTAYILLQTVSPRVTASHLQAITTSLAQASTRFSEAQRNRSHNIRQAVARINGTVLLPGDVFSYNQTVGPRTLREGFRKAPIILHGELVPGDGGGVCQVSSTLYMAALQAGLQIVQRSKHTFPIGYAPAGLDATVVYGVLDLRFRNNTDSPIAIIAHAKRGRMMVSIWGAEGARRKVSIQRIVHSVTSIPVKIVPAPHLPTGVRRVVTKGHSGMRVSVYRIIEEPGKPPMREKISTDTYRPQARVIMVGQAKPVEEPPQGSEAPTEGMSEL